MSAFERLRVFGFHSVTRKISIVVLLLLPNASFAEKVTVGSWKLFQEEPLCLATLRTWKYEIEIYSLERELGADINFRPLAFYYRGDWSMTGPVKDYFFASDAGLVVTLPVSDHHSADLSLVADDGDFRVPNETVQLFMDVIAAGNSLTVSKNEIEETATGTFVQVEREVLSVTYEGGSDAMHLLRTCAGRW